MLHLSLYSIVNNNYNEIINVIHLIIISSISEEKYHKHIK